ncbi:uncharacterized protein MONOS_8108 [Monocercomonoides exilis]|uniref:uncharacterized protein n=1 Tax=Monocercomonoides exilis TaxID=2049356 RepID=UPI003559E39D|nr:hypothetical protein MONOS_8108 [Monocercomonoides exilis]|eukprot:MONOS_8108.1-p1 / transcript=MONOS_8108.1 / gene=MONOS_8108 / organism=Monocercomonoides_exilis_PA203 / gene_product=unspecified product / transcript_product=unspecified product / location=Mono_scaffold00296:39039-39569(-) / protein_length=177 / sequence_SO=supercontig / SO=protein_coding / is_pseudo=false
MGTSPEQQKSHLLDMKENEGDYQGMWMDEANECNSSFRKTEDMPTQSITEKGESCWNEIFVSSDMSRELAEECKNCVASPTWMGFTYVFAHFKDGWHQLKFKEISSKITDFAKKMLKCVCRLEKQRNESFFIENCQICHFLPNISIIRKITWREHLDLNSVLIIQEIRMQKEKETR